MAGRVTIWTIGHSTLEIGQFLDLLRQHGIEVLIDVRHYPGSRRLPHFGKEALRQSLVEAGVRYEHLVELGGRRPVRADSPNTAWRSAAFRGYADYMQTPAFGEAIARLEEIAGSGRTAIMCAEVLWWRCHRSMIADYLKAAGHTVLHITSGGKLQEHPYTTAARIVEGRLSYESPE